MENCTHRRGILSLGKLRHLPDLIPNKSTLPPQGFHLTSSRSIPNLPSTQNKSLSLLKAFTGAS